MPTENRLRDFAPVLATRARHNVRLHAVLGGVNISKGYTIANVIKIIFQPPVTFVIL